MEYSESFEQAAEYAQAALSLMGKRGITQNPNNFAVWFHYYSGKYPDLTRTLDILLGNNQEFTEKRNTELFEKFFTYDKEGAILNEATNKIEAELNSILKYLGTAGDDAATYGKTLATVSGAMDAGGGAEIKAIISKALTATREMEKRNKSLEEKFNASSREVNQLKGDLEDMRHEAMTDGLTGIPNRKLFDTELRRAAMEAMEKGSDLCLLMLDIDFFKKFNDTHGHQVGDQVLKLLAATLTSCIKGQDTAARYGGEEFSVILPGTSIKDALHVAETIRHRISNKKVVNKTTNENLGQITVSIGAGKFDYGEPLSQLINRADGALYEAKRSGRNQVISQEQVKKHEVEFKP